MDTIRLDALAARQFAVPLEEAAALIMAGRVYIGHVPADKPGEPVSPDTVLTLREKPRKYASRSGYKLEKALRAFGVDPAGRTACDIGASNGGFTDCLLQHGAAHVSAVDVAYGILAWELRQDKRVTVLERTNARHLTAEQIGGPCDLATADVSFISLKKIFPAVDRILQPGGESIAIWSINEEHVDQSWYFEPADEGKPRSAQPEDGKTYYIRARHSGQVLALENGSEASGTKAIQHYQLDWRCEWIRLEAAPDDPGYYYLIPGNTPEKVLQLSDEIAWTSNRIELAENTGEDKQKFQFEYDSDAQAYRISAKAQPENCIEVAWESYDKNATIVSGFYIGTSNQQWILDEISEQIRSSVEYNSDGSLVSKVTDARGNGTTYSYEGNPGLVTKVTDATDSPSPKENEMLIRFMPI